MDSNALLKADKGAGAKSGGDNAKTVKPKVKGASLVAKKKSIKKSNVSGLASKIAKYSPSRQTVSKKSVTGKGPKALATPGET